MPWRDENGVRIVEFGQGDIGVSAGPNDILLTDGGGPHEVGFVFTEEQSKQNPPLVRLVFPRDLSDVLDIIDSPTDSDNCAASRQIANQWLDETKALAELWEQKKRECNNEECGWVGPESETVHPKHEPTDRLCPECHETTEEQ